MLPVLTDRARDALRSAPFVSVSTLRELVDAGLVVADDPGDRHRFTLAGARALVELLEQDALAERLDRMLEHSDGFPPYCCRNCGHPVAAERHAIVDRSLDVDCTGAERPRCEDSACQSAAVCEERSGVLYQCAPVDDASADDVPGAAHEGDPETIEKQRRAWVERYRTKPDGAR